MKYKVTLHRKSKILNTPKSMIDDIVRKTLKHIDKQSASLSLVLCNNKFIQEYNNEFRRQNKPTNVLSFNIDFQDPDNPDYIGDVIISLEKIRHEAIEQEKDEFDHFTHILIHGILHLCGYNHIHQNEQEEMESLEISILRQLGINKNPYL